MKPSANKTKKKRPSPRRKKLVLKDRVRVVLITACFIAAAMIVSGTIAVLNRASPGRQAALAETEPAKPSEEPADLAAPQAAPMAAPQAAPKATTRAAPQAAPQAAPKATTRAAPMAAPMAAPKAMPASGTGSQERLPRAGSLVFVIDDAGNSLRELDPFLKISWPLTIAVLPGLPYSAEAARRIRASGKDVILHQPMEALGGQEPGPGAIYSGMSEGEIRSILARNLAEIGPVAGMNNHQGSKITMDENTMEIVLSVCRERGIYFLDSRTTAETAVPRVAKRLGIKIGERDVFVDNIQEKADMIRSIREGMDKAEKKGAAVMIGHVWSSELAATLEELYPDMAKEGYSLATISGFMMGKIDDEGTWN